MSGRFQFSVATLLSTVTVVAVVLWLMLRVDPRVGEVALLVLTLTCLAFTGVAFLYGRDGGRPFCIGVVVPLLYSFFEASYMGLILNVPIPGIPIPRDVDRREVVFLGSALLLGVTLGYLCVIFRWLIQRRNAPVADGHVEAATK
jgi:hypothetical protein